MATHDRFLQAIREAPDDDQLRLVFAVYLEEHNDPRAELFRLTLARARNSPADPSAIPLRREERRLAARDRAAWLGPLAARPVSWEVHRGLLLLRADAAWLAEVLAADPSAGRALRWVETLRLVGDPGRIAALLAAGPLTLVRTLNLSWVPLRPAAGAVGAALRGLPYLEELKLAECRLGPDGVTALGRAALPRLRVLDLTGNDLTDDGARALAESPVLSTVQHLILNKNELTAAGMVLLIDSPTLSPGARVELIDRPTGSAEDARKNQNEGLHEALLLRLHHRAGRTEFRLSGSPLGDEGLGALAASPMLRQFHTLQLRQADVGWRGVRDLAESANVAGLVELDLYSNRIGPEGTKALAFSAYLEGLQRLELGENSIGDGGVRNLAASPHLWRLKELKLSGNGISDLGLRALLESPLLRRLEWLDLGENHLTDAGAEALADSPLPLARLRMRLGGNLIHEAGRATLERRFRPAMITWW